MKRLAKCLLLAGAIVLALGLCACGSANTSASASASSSTSGAVSAASESAVSASSGASAASSSTSGVSASSASNASATEASSTAAGFDFVDECIDEHQNVTLYALTELKGWQLATLLDQQQYQWNAAETMWLRPMDGASFAAVKETGAYTIDTYNEMNEKGGGIAAMALHVVAGYKDPQAALAGNAKCVVEDSYFDGNNGIAIFYGPSMKEYLAIIGPNSESTTLFMIFSQEAVASGMADHYLGTTTGGSFKSIWKIVTGKDSYGH